MSEENKNIESKEEVVTKTTNIRSHEQLEVDVQKFNVKLKDALSEFNLALGAQASITSDGRIKATPNIFDADLLKTQNDTKTEITEG